jgi:hypothetical protein
MAFQVVELTVDADDNVIDRRAVPYPYPTRGPENTSLNFSNLGSD